MRLYGSTPIGYMVAFSMPRPIALLAFQDKHDTKNWEMLNDNSPAGVGKRHSVCREWTPSQCINATKMHGLITLDNPRHACRITGFLPLHIAVVNGLTGMFDFLLNFSNIRELEAYRSRPNLISTRVGQFREHAGLTPLQLAAKVGDHRLFQYIMRRTAKVLWVWGPVTQYELSLDQIDSTGDTCAAVTRPSRAPPSCARYARHRYAPVTHAAVTRPLRVPPLHARHACRRCMIEVSRRYTPVT